MTQMAAKKSDDGIGRVGTLAEPTGMLTLDKANPAKSKVEVTFQVANLRTGVAKLDEHPLFRPLTLHDAALINAVGAAIVPPLPDPQEVQDALEMVRTLLPLVKKSR